MGKASIEDVLRNDTRTVEDMFARPQADPDPEPEHEEPVPEIELIRIELIDANWKNFYHTGLAEEDLAESIKLIGLLTPLGVVEAAGGRYRLISGHRRLKALKWLHDSEPDGRERWGLVPCVVYERPKDADQEELMLIHANSTARELTSYEKSEQVRRVTEILTRMKENGADLPGRMRAHVAKALELSQTKIARLEAIRHNLTFPGWAQAWQENRISENAANTLSSLDEDLQEWVWDWAIDHRGRVEAITVGEIWMAVEDRDKLASSVAAGRPEDEKPEDEPVPEADTEDEDPDEEIFILSSKLPQGYWIEGTPKTDGRYLCTVDLGLIKYSEQVCDCVGGVWMVYGRPVGDMFRVISWWPLPPKNEGVIERGERDDD